MKAWVRRPRDRLIPPNRKYLETFMMMGDTNLFPEQTFALIQVAGNYNRMDLAAAGMAEQDIDAVLEIARPHTVSISGVKTDILAPDQKALKRTISELHIAGSQAIPKTSSKPRAFFRTWVRAIRTPKK